MPPSKRILNGESPNRRIGVWFLVLLAGIASAIAREPSEPPIPIRAETELPQVLSGEPFRRKLDSPIPGAAWNQADLRDVLRAMSETAQLAIIRDRRVDPRRRVDLAIKNQTHRAAFANIAQSIHAESRIVGHVIYIAPTAAAGTIRTLAEMRSQELAGIRSPRHLAARKRLTTRATVAWGDLSRPREIVTKIATKFRLNVANPDAIPRDLWEGGTLPDMTAAEMLSVILIQFDLTFAWEDAFKTIRLTPLPESPREIAIERPYNITSDKAKALSDWQQSSPYATVRQAGRRTLVRARLEGHERLQRLLGDSPEMGADPVAAAPLERRTFTLTATGVPARAIMDQLEASGIAIEYDAKALEEAGVDFMTPVSIDLDGAPPAAFLKAVFDPLGLAFEFSGTKIRLSPKE